MAQGEESTPLEDEQPQFRNILDNKLKEFVPDDEANEVAAIVRGMVQVHNRTLVKESFVSRNESSPMPRLTNFYGSQAHFVVFAVQNKISANRDELYRVVSKSISKGDLGHLEELISGSDDYQELKADLQETLTAEAVRKVTDFLDEFNRTKTMLPKELLKFLVIYLNYAVPDKMKISLDQFMENEIDA